MKFAALAAFVLLVACGADAPPEAPTRDADGVSLSGDARVGVSARF